MTFITWILDDLALTTTGATGLLYREEALLHTYLARTMTGRTSFHIIRIFGTFTITGITWCRRSEGNSFLDAFDCFFQAQFHHIT